LHVSESTDRIERKAVLRAPVARVWRAIADAREFGTWFRVALEGDFVAGERIAGNITYPGYEHLRFDALVEAIEPERRLALRWHPAAVERDVDYASEPTTLVELRVEPHPEGTLLTIVESGFDALPEARRAHAFRMNAQGWTEQLGNVERHVAAS
jgi:uncharacterized protein YndB with AHSA1/START domain